MANSTIETGNQTTRFQNEVNKEHIRGGRFGPYIGTTVNAIIQVNRDLKKVSIPLVGKLSAGAVKGSSQLDGNEEAISNFAFTMQPTYIRKATKIDNEENEKAEFDLFSEARPVLMSWTMEYKRDQIIQAMAAIEAGGVAYNYGGLDGAYGATAASAANMDTWQAANPDRILYGAVKANLTSGDHTGSLATIDTTNDKSTLAQLSLLKRYAHQASPLIRPVMLKGDEPWYVYFVGSYSYRDIAAALDTIHQNAAPRSMKENPLFTAGDLVYQGIIIKETPDIDKFIDGDDTGSPWDGVWGANAASGDGLDDGGASSARVGVGFFCGAQAIGFGVGRPATFKRNKNDDYEHQQGIGISMKHDIKKTHYNAKQHGMITCFHAAAADA